jgi:hypothetical protein
MRQAERLNNRAVCVGVSGRKDMENRTGLNRKRI